MPSFKNIPNNLLELDLSTFSKDDVKCIQDLGYKQRLCYRWFRYERSREPGHDQFVIYSGSKGKTPYASYRIERHPDARYSLSSQRTGKNIATGRTIQSVIKHLPDDFFYSP